MKAGMSMKSSQTIRSLILLFFLNINIFTVFQDHYSDKIMVLKKDGPSLSHMITTSPEENNELNDIYIQFYIRIGRKPTNLNNMPVIYLQYNQARVFALFVNFASDETNVFSINPGNSLNPAELIHKRYENYKDWCYMRFKVTLARKPKISRLKFSQTQLQPSGTISQFPKSTLSSWYSAQIVGTPSHYALSKLFHYL